MRKRRETNHNNLVIVCEGTDTEYLYFTDMRDYIMEEHPDMYCNIKVVPAPEEVIKKKNPNRAQKGKQLVESPKYHYYCKYETNAADYEKYRAQPTRYVREAALFMKENGYQEGWAVFDNDKHPAHEFAFEYANEDHVRIGFSSYSFEEWLLAHFERSSYAFQHSECKVNDKYLRCGTPQALPGDCLGGKCIAGYLRAKGYLPDYLKDKECLFRDTTLPHLQAAMINAAWLRSLSDAPVFRRNPYTDVDLMVASILKLPDTYRWCCSGQSFRFANSELCASLGNNVMRITNTGRTAVIIKPTQIEILFKNDSSIQPLRTNITLPPDGTFELSFHPEAEALLLKDNCVNIFVSISCH